MKIKIITDLEGVAGVMNTTDWIYPGSKYYEIGKELLTKEVNAAIDGFFAAGAERVVVVDGHGAGAINGLMLDARAELQRGNGKYAWAMSVDDDYDAIAWVGQHPKAGTEYGHLCHTQNFDAIDCVVNGISIGEFGQAMFVYQQFGLVPIFASGCAAFAKEAEKLADFCVEKAEFSKVLCAVKAVRILAECAGKDGMIKGQEIDLASEGKQVDGETLLQMYELKTSRLLEAAFSIGAVLGGCSPEQELLAYKAASALGKAFQLRDDILDLIGDEKKLGKPVNSDLKNEKSTYVALEGMEKTEHEVVRLTEEAIQCLEQLPGDKEFLKKLMLYLVQREY